MLTGVDGSIQFTPAGTEFCLKDFSDFPAGTAITVPSGHEYRVGDQVKFTEEGAAVLDSALTAGTAYTISAVTATSITLDGVTLNGDGGSGTADTAGAANHINIDFAEFLSVCQVKGFSLSLTRESIDTTVLPCGQASGNGKMAPFRTSQSGYASGEGSMQVQFTDDQTSLANRLLANSMLTNQGGAEVRLFVSTKYDALGAVDTTNSLYVEGPISIQGFSLSVTPEEAIVADLQFTFSGQPTKILGF
ncbi:MAG: hypothetical protein ACO23G_10845 [Limnohabitans sp.]